MNNSVNKVEVKLTTNPGNIEAGKEIQLFLSITENNKPISIEISHEMKVHFLIVDEALTWFSHIHSEEHKDGTFISKETFPYGGKYYIYADYKPVGSEPQVKRLEIEVSGKLHKNEEISESKFVSEADDYKVTLLNGKDFKTNRMQPLNISIEKDGKVLQENEIQQYLGASSHIVMIRESNKDFLHIHPISNKKYSLYAESYIQRPDIYRIWVQFRINNKVHIADFTVSVAEGENEEMPDAHHQHAH